MSGSLIKCLGALVCAVALSPAQTAALEEELLTAARRGDVAAVKSLLDKGAPIEAKSRYGQTPLYFAAWSGHEEVVKLLLARGADPTVKDTFYKMSALAVAVDKRRTGVAKLLVATGKYSSEDLNQALASAEQYKLADLAEDLKKAGAKPPPKPTATVSEEKLKLYAGTYKGDPVGEVVFMVKEGKLFMSAQGYTMELGAFDDTTFGLAASPQSRFKFNVVEGRVTEVALSAGPNSFVLKRVEGK